jgi:heptosyltransferase I
MKRASIFVRFLDFYLGIPIVFLLGIFRKKRKNIPKQIKKIGILKTAAIGDTVLLSAIIKDLHKYYPKADIILFAAKDNAILAPFIPHLSKCVILPVKNGLKAIKQIRKYQVDILLDFGAWPRINAILSFFVKAKIKIGFNTKGQYRHYIYDHAIEHNGQIHEIDNYRNLISRLGVKSKSLPILKYYSKTIPAFLKQKKHIVFHLWCAGGHPEAKQWPLNYWKELFDFLNANFSIVLTGNKKNFSQNEYFIKLCNQPSNLHNVAGKISLSDTMAILKKASLVISVNTGIMHVTAAINVPLIALSGATNIARWGALGANSKNIFAKTNGCQYLNLGFEYKKQRKNCMQDILPSEVIKETSLILQKNRFCE